MTHALNRPLGHYNELDIEYGSVLGKLALLRGSFEKSANGHQAVFYAPASYATKADAMDDLDKALHYALSESKLSLAESPLDASKAFNKTWSYDENGSRCDLTVNRAYFLELLKNASFSTLAPLALNSTARQRREQSPMFTQLALRTVQTLTALVGKKSDFDEHLLNMAALHGGEDQLSKFWSFASTMGEVAMSRQRELAAPDVAASLERFRAARDQASLLLGDTKPSSSPAPNL